MGKNNDKDTSDDIVELGGNRFRRVKNGLDEAEITPFVNELINQRDALVQREEHLTSLTKLAEKTITEADKLAEDIKAQAMEQAETEAAALIAEAEEKSKKAVEEKQTEIINDANEEAANIKAEAQRKAELLLDNERKKIQPELNNFIHQLSSQLISELENLKNQAVSLGAELEQKLAQFAAETSSVSAELEEVYEPIYKPIQNVDQIYTDELEEKVPVVADDQDTTDYEREPEWEIEILPPMDIMKVMGVVTHLDNLPEVEKTEIIPRNDKPSIVVFLREPIQLIDVLRTIPEVAKVEEDASDISGTNGKMKKVQIALSEKSVTQEAA